MKQLGILCVVLFSLISVKGQLTVTHTYQVVQEFPHDSSAFTQGLIFDNPTQNFYEGTGLYGKSSIRQVIPSTGAVIQMKNITNTSIFGEGITIFPGNNLLYQLTWLTRDVFVYNRTTFELITRFTNPRSEGWGLTHNNTLLILSDGSSQIFFIDPEDFSIQATISVQTSNGAGVYYLNELEYIEGEIWANIWQSNYIVKINPRTGLVTGVIDFTGMYNGGGDVLNGIAYDEEGSRLFVTGKQWSKLFQVNVCPKSKSKKSTKCFPSGSTTGKGNKKAPHGELYIVLSILFFLLQGSLL